MNKVTVIGSLKNISEVNDSISIMKLNLVIGNVVDSGCVFSSTVKKCISNAAIYIDENGEFTDSANENNRFTLYQTGLTDCIRKLPVFILLDYKYNLDSKASSISIVNNVYTFASDANSVLKFINEQTFKNASMDNKKLVQLAEMLKSGTLLCGNGFNSVLSNYRKKEVGNLIKINKQFRKFNMLSGNKLLQQYLDIEAFKCCYIALRDKIKLHSNITGMDKVSLSTVVKYFADNDINILLTQTMSLEDITEDNIDDVQEDAGETSTNEKSCIKEEACTQDELSECNNDTNSVDNVEKADSELGEAYDKDYDGMDDDMCDEPYESSTKVEQHTFMSTQLCSSYGIDFVGDEPYNRAQVAAVITFMVPNLDVLKSPLMISSYLKAYTTAIKDDLSGSRFELGKGYLLNNKKDKVLFNLGVSGKFCEDIYIFAYNINSDIGSVRYGVMVHRSLLDTYGFKHVNDLPRKIRVYRNTNQLVCNISSLRDVDINDVYNKVHILKDNVSRLGYKYKGLNVVALSGMLEGAIKRSINDVINNPLLALPIYSMSKRIISHVIPISISSNEVDLVGLLTQRKGKYYVVTVLTPEMAYLSSMMLCDASSTWLGKMIK